MMAFICAMVACEMTARSCWTAKGNYKRERKALGSYCQSLTGSDEGIQYLPTKDHQMFLAQPQVSGIGREQLHQFAQ